MNWPTTRVLITGANGLLGQAAARYFANCSQQVLALSREKLDITDAIAVKRQIADFNPHLVINCAAMARVDACEVQPALAQAVNVNGAAHLAAACNQTAAWLMHLSTDYVFAGTNLHPYTIDDPPAPLSNYGQTKYLGEQAVMALTPRYYIVRVARLFGPGGQNFGSQIFDRLQQTVVTRQPLKICGYPVSQATYLPDLVARLALIAERQVAGIYHVTNRGPISSWWEFALDAAAILYQATANPAFQPAAIVELMQLVDYPEIGLPAPRPRYSALECIQSTKLQLPLLRDWRLALAAMFHSR